MINYVQPGANVTIVAPYALTSGQAAQVGAALFGVAVTAIGSGSTGTICTAGVFRDITKNTGASENYVAGTRVFWDNTNRRLTTVSTGNLAVGVSLETVATGAAVSGEFLVRPSTPAAT